MVVRLLTAKMALGRVRQVEQPARHDEARRLAEVALAHELLRDGQAGLLQGPLVAPQPLTRRVGIPRPADDGDAPVAQADEVGHRRVGGALVVDHHAVGGDADDVPVDGHDGHAHVQGPADGRLVLVRGGDDEPGGPLGRHDPQAGGLPLGALVRVGQDEGVAVPARHVLGTAGDGREERVADVADDEAQDAGAPRAHVAGQVVGRVVELLGGLDDALQHGRADEARDRPTGPATRSPRRRLLGQRHRPSSASAVPGSLGCDSEIHFITPVKVSVTADPLEPCARARSRRSGRDGRTGQASDRARERC